MKKCPVIYFRDSVIYPAGIEVGLVIGREDSIFAINESIRSSDSVIAVITQTKGEEENPEDGEVFEVGTICKIQKKIDFSDGTMKVLVKGILPFKVKKIYKEEGIKFCDCETFDFGLPGANIEEGVKDHICELLRKFNPRWIEGENKEQFEKFIGKETDKASFILKASHLISNPYTGIQKRNELEKIKRDLDYWKGLNSTDHQEMNSRISKRIKLLSARALNDKMRILKEILQAET